MLAITLPWHLLITLPQTFISNSRRKRRAAPVETEVATEFESTPKESLPQPLNLPLGYNLWHAEGQLCKCMYFFLVKCFVIVMYPLAIFLIIIGRLIVVLYLTAARRWMLYLHKSRREGMSTSVSSQYWERRSNFPKGRLLPFIRAVVQSEREKINEENFKCFGERVHKVYSKQ